MFGSVEAGQSFVAILSMVGADVASSPTNSFPRHTGCCVFAKMICPVELCVRVKHVRVLMVESIAV